MCLGYSTRGSSAEHRLTALLIERQADWRWLCSLGGLSDRLSLRWRRQLEWMRAREDALCINAVSSGQLSI